MGPLDIRPRKNARNFGATGGGSTGDNTAGSRCGESRESDSRPCCSLFPSGNLCVSVDPALLRLVGSPDAIPTLEASPDLEGIAAISSDSYIAGGSRSERVMRTAGQLLPSDPPLHRRHIRIPRANLRLRCGIGKGAVFHSRYPPNMARPRQQRHKWYVS